MQNMQTFLLFSVMLVNCTGYTTEHEYNFIVNKYVNIDRTKLTLEKYKEALNNISHNLVGFTLRDYITCTIMHVFVGTKEIVEQELDFLHQRDECKIYGDSYYYAKIFNKRLAEIINNSKQKTKVEFAEIYERIFAKDASENNKEQLDHKQTTKGDAMEYKIFANMKITAQADFKNKIDIYVKLSEVEQKFDDLESKARKLNSEDYISGEDEAIVQKIENEFQITHSKILGLLIELASSVNNCFLAESENNTYTENCNNVLQAHAYDVVMPKLYKTSANIKWQDIIDESRGKYTNCLECKVDIDKCITDMSKIDYSLRNICQDLKCKELSLDQQKELVCQAKEHLRKQIIIYKKLQQYMDSSLDIFCQKNKKGSLNSIYFAVSIYFGYIDKHYLHNALLPELHDSGHTIAALPQWSEDEKEKFRLCAKNLQAYLENINTVVKDVHNLGIKSLYESVDKIGVVKFLTKSYIDAAIKYRQNFLSFLSCSDDIDTSNNENNDKN